MIGCSFATTGAAYLPDPTDPYQSPPRELYVVGIDGGEPRKLTSVGVDVLDFSWSSDSKRLVFSADAHQRDEYTYERADLWLVDLNGDVERLTDDGFHHTTPAFSPDGARVAYRRVKGLSLVIAEKAKRGAPVDVYVMDLASRDTTNVTASWDLRPGGPVWNPDARSSFRRGRGREQASICCVGGLGSPGDGRRSLAHGFQFHARWKSGGFCRSNANVPFRRLRGSERR